MPAWFALGLWFVLQWAFSGGYSDAGAGSVAYLAHVVGFMFGALVGLLARSVGTPAPRPMARPRW